MQIHTPLAVISGHSRAVSYVRWLGSDSIVSASTDNHLKLWDVGTATQSLTGCKPVMSYTGDARPACSGLELTRCVNLATAPNVTAEELSCWQCSCMLLLLHLSELGCGNLTMYVGKACARYAHPIQQRHHFQAVCLFNMPSTAPAFGFGHHSHLVTLQSWPFEVCKAGTLPW